MTRAPEASNGLATPPPLHRWMDAVLMFVVSLAHSVRTTLAMIFNRTHRDWHTEDAREALLQATSGISSQETITTHGVTLGLVPRVSAGPSRGLSIDPLETQTQDSGHKTENESAIAVISGMEADKVRVRGEGRGPVLRAAQTRGRRSALMRADQTPALILSVSKDARDTAEGIAPKPA